MTNGIEGTERQVVQDELSESLGAIAIIGMAGRFPGAASVAEFWKNQLSGVEAISHFTVDELELSNAKLSAHDSNYVRARSILDEVDQFDAEFFGVLPKEAALMDPQHRLFLESCWQAFEDAGYDPFTFAGSIGVIAGSSYGSYFLSQICAQPGFVQDFLENYQIGNYPTMMGNQPEFLPTRVSYKFNLRGPSFAIQSACSTSLLAVCQACQSLLTYQSDMMLAGGVSITLPQRRGYIYQEGGMGSADGHCRPFDKDAQGTVFGSGVAVVLLKRLEDAVADGDHIYSVIRGFAANNDGAAKIGYTAPSVDGQANVIAMAQQAAGIDPRTIGYIEAHGTATPLGDPIELAALTKAFRASTDDTQFCTIGTAKANLGHLDIAAGITGLIHASHVVREGKFPATLNFKQPTDKFDLAHSPFRVNPVSSDWPASCHPRRAGVSAFGVGGTNAHVVIEEAPRPASDPSVRTAQLLPLSARSSKALDEMTRNIAEHLKSHPESSLPDVAYTLQVGRRAFDHRRFVVAENVSDAITALESSIGRNAADLKKRTEQPNVCFMFPGQGSQHSEMGRELYQNEAVFRTEVDRCADLLHPQMGVDLRTVFFCETKAEDPSLDPTQTYLAQPGIFIVEYALAKLWMSWGIEPSAMIGHSVGEYVAACLSGVLSLEDALYLVASRGRLMQQLPAGDMLSVRASESKVRPLLEEGLDIAAINAPELCVVSGPNAAIQAFEDRLNNRDIVHRRLHTSHAFHSAMMDPILPEFRTLVAKIKFGIPKIPYISGVSGTWITPEHVADSDYWTHHIRDTVRFSQGISVLMQPAEQEIRLKILLEVGPGTVLATLARQHVAQSSHCIIHTSLANGNASAKETDVTLHALGSLWCAGAQPRWAEFHGGVKRLRTSLPSYPFERKRFWLTENGNGAALASLNAVEAPDTNPTGMAGVIPVLVQQETLLMSATTANAPRPRRQVLSANVTEIFEELSGLSISSDESSSSFLELGFDSLFLTQVSQSLQNKFGVKITFRQLLGDQSSLDALSEYLDSQLPAGAFEDAVAPAAAGVKSVVSGAQLSANSGQPVMFANPTGTPVQSSVEQLMRDQLQAMNSLFAQQLSALNASNASSQSVPATTGSAPTAVPTAAPSKPSPPDGSSATKDAAGVELKGYTPFKPLQKSVSGELNARQLEHIQNLTKLYTSRTAASKRMTQESRKYLADPRVVAGFRVQWKEMVYPIITSRSKGSRLWDLDGNEYIDILNGFGPIMLGHRPSYVEEAIEKQLHEGFEIGPQTALAGEVAKALCEMTGNERATFCNTGSEAVIAAMRLARTISGKSRVVFFAGDYHGMFDEVLVKGFKRAGVPQSAPIAPGIPRESVSNMTVLEYGSQESLEWIRAHANELAAVLVEPVQSRHPNLQPVEFLRELRRITENADVCLIFDEVVTGFRSHPGGCQALFDIRADLATYGKVVAGGMPMGILAGKARYMDALDGGMWQYGDDSFPETGVTFFAGTFVRHPLAMAACAAVLKHLKEQGPELQQSLTQRTAGLIARLNSLLTANEVPTRIETFCSFFYFSFPSDFRFSSLFYYHLRARGIHLLEGFPCFLTTEHSDADLDRIVRAFEETIADMQAGELLPLPSGQALPTVTEKTENTLPALDAPITESQVEILLSAQLSDEANCSFNESLTLHLHGELDQAALSASITDLLTRHEALRASFDLDSRTQRFATPSTVVLPFVDLSGMNQDLRQKQFDNLISDDARRPFDLQNGPLVRMQLVRFDSQHHALVFTAHHAVCDGWSINVFLDELSRIYSARVAGKAPVLDPLMPFSEYALSQDAHFAGSDGAEMESYWLKKFEVLPPLLDLPIDHPRPSVKSYEGATYRRKIDLALLKEVKRAGAQQKCTLFVTLAGAFSALLARLSGQDDIVVGVPSAGQSLVDNKVLVGHCVNFVPMRMMPTEDLTTAQFLDQVRQTVFDAYDHQNYTFGRLVRKLSIPRDASRLPLLEVQFNLEKVGGNLSFPNLKTEVEPNPKSFVNFDVFMNAVEGPDGLTLHVDYNTRLIDDATIARWMDCYEQLLTGIVADATQPLSRLPLLSPEERSRVLYDFNRTQAIYPTTLCAHQLFEQQVLRSPQTTALQFEDQALSYEDLNQRVNRLARYMHSFGIKPGDVVGVYMERSVDMVVSLLATWKAGAAYIPLDPTFPLERLKMVFEDLVNPWVLTQSRLGSQLPGDGVRMLCVDELRPVIDLQSSANIDLPYDPSAVAYVIYTSGSTGRPKGVEVTQSNLVNLLTSMAKEPGLSSQDVLVAVTTISFDIAALEVYLPLIRGAKLVLASRPVASDGNQLLKLLSETRATILQATPVTFRLLLAAGWTGSPKFTAWCGGEALPRDLAEQILACGIPLWNMYGPTETTIWSAVCQVTSSTGPVLVGPPIDNTQFYILDSQLQPVPIGVAGELFIGGDGVAKGYFSRPELTAARFLEDPFRSQTGARIYRTGDLARRLPDGQFEFLGRTDGQIKLRGFRIELGEIETVLAKHPSILQAVVTLREDVAGDKRLIAYVTSSSAAVPLPNDLRTYMLTKLPDYMVPSAFVTLDRLPLTANGKIDRKALPVPDWQPITSGANYVAPVTPQQETLASIWSDVLHLKQVGIEDNIFELGADSLHIFQISARANKLGLNITPLQLFQHRTISAILSETATTLHSPTEGRLVPQARSKYRINKTAPQKVEGVPERTTLQ
jgi:amino acid adenylation domain-containing protein